ncbi:hypothetical protein L2U69_11925 [Zavarzinia compransoris]|uniref:hypothetical protein n=1 Tax=Zavarzinia marina TaxID=2911065 RepID=UPI001F44F143|nr:hypothetical protein [Zavarzinia marina]MCF4166355.1 hypothetical protein [Zavarzinia marina]
MKSDDQFPRKNFSSPREEARMSLSFSADAVRVEAQDRVRDLVRHSGECLKGAFDAVGRRLGGMQPGRVRQLYYGNARQIGAAEMDHIRALHTRFASIIEEQRAIERRMREVMGHEALDHHEADGAVTAEVGALAGEVPPAGQAPQQDDREG